MSYCVNCGVELEASLQECPLCNTPVWNPKEVKKENTAPPFPKEKGQVEVVNRKDFGILLSVVVGATALVCGLLNLYLIPSIPWSLTIIGVCVIIWVMMIPTVIYRKLHIYLSLLLDGGAVVVYLYMLTYMTRSSGWFWGLGLPIVLLVTGVAEVFTVCIRKLPKSFLTIALYVFLAIPLLCCGLEILIDRYVRSGIDLQWSAVVLTICAIVDAAIITLLSRRRLRNAVRRRLHF